MDEHIRTRAFSLWEQAGRPEGQAEHFWFAAAQELAQEAAPAKPVRKRAPRAKKAA